MAKKDPPRPGARPRPSAKRPRAAGAGRSRPSRPTGNAPAAPAPTPKQASGGASWKPNQPDAAPAASELRMVPLTESDADDEGDGGAPKSATSFFALPTPRRKAPVEEPQAPPPSTVPTVGGPPPGMVPGPMGGPPPGMSMGISGPVASGPAGGPPGFTGGTGYGGGPATQHPADTGQERARSYRVFAIVGGLMMMVFMAVLVTLVMVVVVVSQQEDGSSAVVAPEAAPAVAVAVVDTGRVDPPMPDPVPKPRPRNPGKPSPRPAPGPAPAPAPPPAPVGPANAVIIIPASEPFTGIEISCPMSGFRERVNFVSGTATVPNVPVEDCNVNFKGGPPAKNTIRGGQTKNCTFPNGSANCN